MKIQSASNHGLEALLIPSFTEAHRLKLETRPKPASREPNIPVQIVTREAPCTDHSLYSEFQAAPTFLIFMKTQDIEMFAGSIQHRLAGSQPEHHTEALAFILLRKPISIVGL